MHILIGPPQLSLPQNRTVEVNVSEEVVLNCTASSSPDPVYSWLIIPDSCSSCPKYSNDSIINFTANISSKGDYICAAKNDYGTATKRVTINVLCKLTMHAYCSYIRIFTWPWLTVVNIGYVYYCKHVQCEFMQTIPRLNA